MANAAQPPPTLRRQIEVEKHGDSRGRVTLLRRVEVEKRLRISRSWIYDRLDPGSPRYDATFPTPIRLGGSTEGRGSAVAWIEAELETWIAAQITARGAP